MLRIYYLGHQLVKNNQRYGVSAIHSYRKIRLRPQIMKSNKSFVEARILSLRRLVESCEVRDMFERTDCNFNKV